MLAYENGWNDAQRGSDHTIGFYEREFYVFSNFSSFSIEYQGIKFPTAEHLYYWHKFSNDWLKQSLILLSASAHDAFILAQQWKSEQRHDWDAVKLDIMYHILRLKVEQHPYVKKKLFETGKRILVEDSWRDSFWGWGPDKDGLNWLGRLWMRLRGEIFPELA